MVIKGIFSYLLVGILLVNGCASKHIYDDSIISRSKNAAGVDLIEFNRHGLLYKDKKVKNKIIERYVYEGQKLIYRYPITKEVIGKTTLRLLSGKGYLTVNVLDTLRIENINLPIMNRTTYVRGGVISRIDDSTYYIKVMDAKNGFVKAFVNVSANYEEIKGDMGYVADSLTVAVR